MMMRAEPLFSFNGSFSLPLPHETKEEMAFGEKKGLKMGGRIEGKRVEMGRDSTNIAQLGKHYY